MLETLPCFKKYLLLKGSRCREIENISSLLRRHDFSEYVNQHTNKHVNENKVKQNLVFLDLRRKTRWNMKHFINVKFQRCTPPGSCAAAPSVSSPGPTVQTSGSGSCPPGSSVKNPVVSLYLCRWPRVWWELLPHSVSAQERSSELNLKFWL